ncbi:MAG: alcohol dehydrogenase catalytic domain-containing protein [Nitrospiraceae bacterium]|nr:alcohol dehydrogenase catalytic domain-containing protein [Nitrospiraceae bacterium]
MERIPIPVISGPSVRVEMRACGICGSDIRYYHGENPWSLHTLGRNVPCPPNMVLGHEISGIVKSSEGNRRVAILAYKGCGECVYCRVGQENLCGHMVHLGHSAGWDPMPYYPGGMAHTFEVWQGFDYDIPDSISFDAAVFLDGLAVAVHAVDQGGLGPGAKVGFVGLGPVGLLAAQVARAKSAGTVVGCDVDELPTRLAREVGLPDMAHGDSADLVSFVKGHNALKDGLDMIVDTVGSAETIQDSLSLLRKGGALVLLAVHEAAIPLRPTALSGERRIVTSANNRYEDFTEAIRLLSEGRVRVDPLVTHRLPLEDAAKAFELMADKLRNGVYKIVLHP